MREAVLVEAQRRAAAEGAAEIGVEHLYAALTGTARCAARLAAIGLGAAQVTAVREALEHSRRRAGLSRRDADALQTYGIDVASLVERAEAQLGQDALAAAAPATGGGRRSQRPPRSLPFAGEAKRAIEGALRQARARADRELREEHLLLGMLTVRGPLADALADQGVTLASVHSALDALDAPAAPGGSERSA